MKPIIAANWKCHPSTVKKAENLIRGVNKGIKEISEKTEVIICPPFVYLSKIQNLTSNIQVGAQDCFWKKEGSFTGEVSPSMLKSLGVKYVIVGHSERREIFGETENTINKKMKAALNFNLKPILCVGEKEEEKDQKVKVIKKELLEDLKDISSEDFKKVLVAYEPLWAIGSGNNCSPAKTRSSVLLIRKILAEKYKRKLADKTKILYGGSVDSTNAVSYIEKARADGLLIGSASLRAEEFVKIIKKTYS